MNRTSFLFLPATFIFIGASCGTADTGTAPDQSCPRDTEDAVVLALQAEPGGQDIALDRSLIAQFQHLLHVARAANPVVLANIHATPRLAVDTISLRATGRVAAAFDHGDPRTGIAGLDSLLAKYQLSSVRVLAFPPSPDRSATIPNAYSLRFKVPIRTTRLAEAIKALAIDGVSSVSPSLVIGDGCSSFAATSTRAISIT